jgi:hypothetical protein
MRRTSATHLIAPATAQAVRLADMHCRTCGAACDGPEAVIALRQTANGADECAWCSISHARQHGWPFLARERAAPVRKALQFTCRQ